MPENANTEARQEGLYKKASSVVDNWLKLHKDESFDLDLICRQLEIRDPEKRNLITIKLAYEVKTGHLEKFNKVYRYIDRTSKLIDWVNAPDPDPLGIIWPYGIEDNSHFGFDGHITISPGDVVVIAGVSNMGKTTFILNLLWNNMDIYPCTLMGNEYSPGKFKRRVSRMQWADPLKPDGTPKFELIERREGWKDIIRPDSINLIDWISIGDNFYQMGKVIEGIQAPLRKGIAVIAIQKSGNKELGEGGRFSEQLASLYLLMDFERLTVRKAKEWSGQNPNGQVYGFNIVNGGTHFHNIRPLKKCGFCFQGKKAGQECVKCRGTGWVDECEL